MSLAPGGSILRNAIVNLSWSAGYWRGVKSKTQCPCVSLNVTSLAIEELPPVIKQDVEEFLENHSGSPAARLRPRIGMVGDMWLAFVGPKLRTGASGLGLTPRGALEDFNQHFLEPIISRNGSEPH